MAEPELLKVWYSVDDSEAVGTLKWNRQPVLSVLRGIVAGRQRLEVRQERVCSHGQWRMSLEYGVSRGGERIGTVNVEVGPRSVAIRVYSVHPGLFDGLGPLPGRVSVVKWDWNGRAFGRSWSWDGSRIWKVTPKPRPRPKFRRLGTRIRKVLLEYDDMPCVEQVMLS